MVLPLLLLSSLLARPSAAQIVVTDPGQTAVAQMQYHLQLLHTQFMKLQMVQDAVILKNNYLQTKEYYDMVYEHSQHRGGLMGYYKDYFEQQLDDAAADQWRHINAEASSISSGTFVNTLVAEAASDVAAGTEDAIGGASGVVGGGLKTLDGGYGNARGLLFHQKKAQVAAIDAINAASEQRADATTKQIAEVVKRGSSSMISDSERESIQLHAQLLQLQLLSELRQLMNVNTQILNERAKEDLAESALALKASAALADHTSSQASRATASQDAIVRELKRRPGE